MSNYTKVPLKIARKLTSIGNEEYVGSLLEAHNSVVMQKGLFHQLMHQAAVIYIIFYGGFIQAMQVANGVKRVTGDPVKGNYQDHDRFLCKLYKACIRFRKRKFVLAQGIEFWLMKDGETKDQFLRREEERFNDFVTKWETGNHEPSRLVSLFIKYTASYLSCKHGIRKGDFWLCEKESNLWIAPWKVCNKSTYLRLQCE